MKVAVPRRRRRDRRSLRVVAARFCFDENWWESISGKIKLTTHMVSCMSGPAPPFDLDVVVPRAVEVLSAFGVTRGDVRDRWGYTGGDDLADAVRSVLRRVTDPPAEVIRETVADTDRCVDAPARYWDTALQIQLERAFGALGGTVEVVDATGTRVDEGGTEEPFRVAVTDARGRTHTTTFSYPGTPLGRDNYAAAIHAVEGGLLDDTGYTFAPIDGPGERWRFALVDAERLAALRERLGERLRIAGDPVLGPHPASDYVPDGDGLHVPEWVDEYDDGSVASVSAREVFDVEAYIESRDAPKVDEVLDGTDPEEIAETATGGGAAATPDGGAVGEDFAGFVDDLGTTGVPDPTPAAVAAADATAGGDAGEGGEGGTAADGTTTDVAIDAGASVDRDDGDGLDRAFAQIEREAATETAGAAETAMASERHESAVVAMANGADPDDLPQDIFGAEKSDAPEFDWVEDEDLDGR